MKRTSFHQNSNKTEILHLKGIHSILLFPAFLLLLTAVYSPALSQTNEKQRDGKLLRGEKWQKFEPAEKADFYVSTAGNDFSGCISRDGNLHTTLSGFENLTGLK